MSRLVAQSAFQLEIPLTRTDPLVHLWIALFPFGHDLRESTSCCTKLGEDDVHLREKEWESYVKWRKLVTAQRCLEEFDITQEDKRPGNAEDRIKNPQALNSDKLLGMVEQDADARRAMQGEHFAVLGRWYYQIVAARN